jgi:hypothetical protein
MLSGSNNLQICKLAIFVPCRPKHDPKCVLCRAAHRAEILGTTRPSYSCRAGTAQNLSCRAVLWVVPKCRASYDP